MTARQIYGRYAMPSQSQFMLSCGRTSPMDSSIHRTSPSATPSLQWTTILPSRTSRLVEMAWESWYRGIGSWVANRLDGVGFGEDVSVPDVVSIFSRLVNDTFKKYRRHSIPLLVSEVSLADSDTDSDIQKHCWCQYWYRHWRRQLWGTGARAPST